MLDAAQVFIHERHTCAVDRQAIDLLDNLNAKLSGWRELQNQIVDRGKIVQWSGIDAIDFGPAVPWSLRDDAVDSSGRQAPQHKFAVFSRKGDAGVRHCGVHVAKRKLREKPNSISADGQSERLLDSKLSQHTKHKVRDLLLFGASAKKVLDPMKI